MAKSVREKPQPSEDDWGGLARASDSPFVRTPQQARPIWEQNGNRTGNITSMRPQCTCVRAVS
jgi:hypothetical protein